MNAPNMFWLIVAHEARVLVADRTLALVCGLLALMIGYGLFVGLSQAKLRDRMVIAVLAYQETAQKSKLALLQSVLAGKEAPVPFNNPANPAAIAGGLAGSYVVMPSAPLAPVAIGQSDMIPNYYRITYRSKVEFMYDTEIENPWNLLSGHFDLAFVIVFLLPLLIFSVSYNLLSAEREQGTLRMLCAQPLTVSTLVLGKVAVRAAALLGCAVLLPVAILLLARPETRHPAQLLLMSSWSALVIAYGLFWFAFAVLVNTVGRSSSANALILVATWTVLVLILPAVHGPWPLQHTWSQGLFAGRPAKFRRAAPSAFSLRPPGSSDAFGGSNLAAASGFEFGANGKHLFGRPVVPGRPAGCQEPPAGVLGMRARTQSSSSATPALELDPALQAIDEEPVPARPSLLPQDADCL